MDKRSEAGSILGKRSWEVRKIRFGEKGILEILSKAGKKGGETMRKRYAKLKGINKTYSR